MCHVPCLMSNCHTHTLVTHTHTHIQDPARAGSKDMSVPRPWNSLYRHACLHLRCNTQHRTATHCNALQCAGDNEGLPNSVCCFFFLSSAATHCCALQHTTPHCSTLHCIYVSAAHCSALQRAVTHCTVLHRTASQIGRLSVCKLPQVWGMVPLPQVWGMVPLPHVQPTD